MSKSFKAFLAVWAVAFLLFNVLAFAVGGKGLDLFNRPTWFFYIFGIVGLALELIFGAIALKSDDQKKIFFGMPLLNVINITTPTFTAACLLFLNLASLPVWIGIVVCAAILATSLYSCIGATVAMDYIAEQDVRDKQAVATMRTLQAQAQALVAQANTTESRASANRVCDALRYSDPVSSPAVAGIEYRLMEDFQGYANLLRSPGVSPEAIVAVESSLISLLNERNALCKLNK